MDVEMFKRVVIYEKSEATQEEVKPPEKQEPVNPADEKGVPD